MSLLVRSLSRAVLTAAFATLGASAASAQFAANGRAPDPLRSGTGAGGDLVQSAAWSGGTHSTTRMQTVLGNGWAAQRTIVSADLTVGLVNNSLILNNPAQGWNNARYQTNAPKYSGVARMIMQYSATNLNPGDTRTIPAAGFICSGSLLKGGSLLTAAHCVVKQEFGQYTFPGCTPQPNLPCTVNVRYDLANTQVQLGPRWNGVPQGQEPTGANPPFPGSPASYDQVIDVPPSATFLHPDYSGQVIDGNDVAVLNLPVAAAPMFQQYQISNVSAVGQDVNIAGWGGRTNGDPATSFASVGLNLPNGFFWVPGGAGARRRQGMNTFDFLASDPDMFPLFGPSPGVQSYAIYMTDFDNGRASQDASCVMYKALGGTGREAQFCDLGLGLDEVNTAGGDSGGPSFYNGLITSVTSFGITFGGACLGGPDIDQPAGPEPLTCPNDFWFALNSSFGEMSGYSALFANTSWLIQTAGRQAVVPEPGTVILMGSGLIALVAARRRMR
ncbi:MAG: PEP-CTERM sorting domain-containing protein [Gemmatimonadales bacterium]|nr:PEP-CTERM sorting domain-containing protein [Gemmatimonadales bacterium]